MSTTWTWTCDFCDRAKYKVTEKNNEWVEAATGLRARVQPYADRLICDACWDLSENGENWGAVPGAAALGFPEKT